MNNEQYYIDIMAAKHERTEKRLWIVILVLIAALIVSNGWWVYYESQFATEETESYTAEANDGGNAIISGEGDITIG